ncbi:TPA: hypothetical protein N2C25_003940 [Pseudomonas aeruginosa]|nr:hypothetical protein [Pseudomonas aeruginosa]
MNDRELLELAAREAGLGEVWYLDGFDTPYIGKKFQIGRPIEYTTWRPLEDDGDALRLAVKRGLVVTPDRENQRTLVSNQAGHEYCAIYWDKLGEMAATRLAITEAAAEIGKSMGGGE